MHAQLIKMPTAETEVFVYPEDDYKTAVDFSLAEPVSTSDVTFVYFDANGREVSFSQLENHSTTVLIHGWLTSIKKSPWYPLMRDAYVAEPEAINVIYVDYEPVAARKYSLAASSTINVGHVIANHFMHSKIEWSNMHIIGHSMGSHVAGYVGRHVYETTGKKVGRITLLDPAGPKFERTPNIVNQDDATFVDVIHTDIGHYGLTKSIGHVDFFPNGGRQQIGCTCLDDNCSHARSTLYFIESIGAKQEIARKASNWEDFLSNQFLDNESITFGEHVPITARGNYYFITNPTAPYFANKNV